MHICFYRDDFEKRLITTTCIIGLLAFHEEEPNLPKVAGLLERTHQMLVILKKIKDLNSAFAIPTQVTETESGFIAFFPHIMHHSCSI